MASMKFTVKVGFVRRAAFISELERVCFKYDIVLEVRKAPGILSTDYYVRVEHPDWEILEALKRALQEVSERSQIR